MGKAEIDSLIATFIKNQTEKGVTNEDLDKTLYIAFSVVLEKSSQEISPEGLDEIKSLVESELGDTEKLKNEDVFLELTDKLQSEKGKEFVDLLYNNLKLFFDKLEENPEKAKKEAKKTSLWKRLFTEKQ